MSGYDQLVLGTITGCDPEKGPVHQVNLHYQAQPRQNVRSPVSFPQSAFQLDSFPLVETRGAVVPSSGTRIPTPASPIGAIHLLAPPKSYKYVAPLARLAIQDYQCERGLWNRSRPAPGEFQFHSHQGRFTSVATILDARPNYTHQYIYIHRVFHGFHTWLKNELVWSF